MHHNTLCNTPYTMREQRFAVRPDANHTFALLAFAPADPPSQLWGAPWGTVAALKRLTAATVVAAELVPSIAPTTTECWTDIVMASKHSCGA